MHKNDGGMGFKSLGTFNIAMLGKQGWKILTNPESRIARIYKARYFPTCNFLESSLGHKPSFVRRSICNAKFVLKAGSTVGVSFLLYKKLFSGPESDRVQSLNAADRE